MKNKNFYHYCKTSCLAAARSGFPVSVMGSEATKTICLGRQYAGSLSKAFSMIPSNSGVIFFAHPSINKTIRSPNFGSGADVI